MNGEDGSEDERRQYGRDGTERKMRRVQVEVRKIESWKKYGEDWKVEYGKGDFSKGKDEKKNKREVRETEEGREKSKKKKPERTENTAGDERLEISERRKKKSERIQEGEGRDVRAEQIYSVRGEGREES